MKTFEEAWREKEAQGYRYGSDALEQVRFGFELAANSTRNTPEGALDMSRLTPLLRGYHAGADRGELMALLVEAWGPSPAVSLPTCPRCTGPLDGAETVAALSAGWPRVDAPVCLKCRRETGIFRNGDPPMPLDQVKGIAVSIQIAGPEESSDLRGLAARESQR